jgi:hypothetical protein
MKAKKIAIVVKPSGRGVLNDAEILKSKISTEYSVTIISHPLKKHPDYFCYGVLRRLLPFLYQCHVFLKNVFNVFTKKRFDLAIYIETTRPEYMFIGNKNVLIPNQEWYSPSLKCLVPYFDEIWCKTHYADDIFASMGKSRYISFSASIDTALRSVTKSTDYFLHRAGNSAIRGTKSLIEVWLRHPEWPTLKIIMDDIHRHELHGAMNIEYIQPPEGDVAFQLLMATSAYHIHPTQTEGYGLAISEGLGYGCMILTTDAPPMNELISSERGSLISVAEVGKQCLSELFHVSRDGMDQVISDLLAYSSDQLASKSAASITWFDKNEYEFTANLNQGIHDLLLSD